MSLMRHIYESAVEVVVFVGNDHRHRVERSDLSQPPSLFAHFPDQDSQLLADFFTRIRGREILESEAPLNVFTIIQLLSSPSMVRHLVQGLMTLDKAARCNLFEHLRVFLVSPWWKRIWVVQEITVNRQVTVRYGYMTAHWNIFEAAVTSLSSIRREPFGAQAISESENWKVLLLLESQVASIRRTRENWQSGEATDLSRLLHEFSNRLASDDHDKVFGLLSLAKPGHGVVPDYNVGVSETFRRTAWALIQSTHSLDVWTGDQRRKTRKDLPSWVPDWSARPNPSDTRRLETLSAYNVSRGWSLRVVDSPEQYWDFVGRSIEELCGWLVKPGQTRKLPMVMRESIKILCGVLDSKICFIDETPCRKLAQHAVSKLDELALLCARSAAELSVPHSKLFNRTYGGLDNPRCIGTWGTAEVRCPCLPI